MFNWPNRLFLKDKVCDLQIKVSLNHDINKGSNKHECNKLSG